MQRFGKNRALSRILVQKIEKHKIETCFRRFKRTSRQWKSSQADRSILNVKGHESSIDMELTADKVFRRAQMKFIGTGNEPCNSRTNGIGSKNFHHVLEISGCIGKGLQECHIFL